MRTNVCLRALLCAAALSFAACSGCDEGTGSNNATNNSTNENNTTASNNGSNNTTGNNTNNTTACDPQTDEEFCADNAATCGLVSAEDNCGSTREVNCGMCADPETCQDDNTCACVDSEADICARMMKDCGEMDVTDNCGVERTVTCGSCMDGEECGASNVCGCPCTIDGECIPEGMANADNPCEVCDPTSSTDDWTPLANGSACDDGIACTSSEACMDGQCEGGDLDADTCLINDTCYADGDVDPDSDCRSCDAAATTQDWTDATDGSSCDDGLACTSGETCNAGDCEPADTTAGTCAIDGACYNQGDINPNNPCEICDPQDQQDDWSDVSQGTVCDDGLACTANTMCDGGGECVGTVMDGTCAIDGVCYNDDEANPNNSCETCDSMQQQDDWSGVAPGEACDDELACTSNDVCDGAGQCAGDVDPGSCLINSSCYADGDTRNGRDCLTCDSAEDQGDWTFLPVDSPCDDGLACTGDGTCNPGGACRDGMAMSGTCAIDGACYMDGDVNPANPCQSCQAALENADWSPLAGDTCDDGLACTSGDTCNADGACEGTVDAGSCAVDGACYADGGPNPDNACEVCDAAADPVDWSAAAQGDACDDGLACTSGETCDGGGNCVSNTITADSCAIDDACYAPGDANPMNSCEVCDPTNDQGDWSNAAADTLCDDDDQLGCTGLCDGAGSCVDDQRDDSCLINDACYAAGDTNPTNGCEVCDPTNEAQDWSIAADGSACGAAGMNICCAGACEAGINACP